MSRLVIIHILLDDYADKEKYTSKHWISLLSIYYGTYFL